MNRKWIYVILFTWAMIILLDEWAYMWWRRANPGSLWSGVKQSHLVNAPDIEGEGYPNGHRPAGGI